MSSPFFPCAPVDGGGGGGGGGEVVAEVAVAVVVGGWEVVAEVATAVVVVSKVQNCIG